MNKKQLIVAWVFLAMVLSGCSTINYYNLLNPLPIEAYKVQFIPKGDILYPPTDVENVEIFRNVNYMGDKKVLFDDKPSRPYIIIGELVFPFEWYFESTLNKLVNREVKKVGGDAILEYNTYQKSAALAKNPENNQTENAFLMSIKAIVIRYIGR
jgi:hypothetical protein